MSLFALLFAKPLPPRQPPPKLVFPSGYTLAEFISHPGMVEEARLFLRSALGGHMLSVLNNCRPSGLPRGSNINETLAAIELGRREGYADALNILNLMTIAPQEGEDIPIDYGVDETSPID